MDPQELLWQLGVTSDCRAFYRCLAAMDILRREPEALTMVTKWLYPAVAKRQCTSWKAVEMDFRRASKKAWACNPGLLNELNGAPLPRRPTSTQFLAILARSMI